jgi:FMN phosphatase YigB (HAD superfamily)
VPTLVFLIDVDNTLIANDDIKNDWDQHIRREMGDALADRFWELYEQARQESGVVDIPLALQRLREQTPLSELDEQTYLHLKSIFYDYPFYKALYPYVLETLHYLDTLGLTVIVSDGDQHFQEKKIINSHLAEAVEGRVLIYTHKQKHLQEILNMYPADHYVMIDDKPDILVDSKLIMGRSLTAVFVQQGHYANDPKPADFAPDISVLHFADLRNYSAEQFLKS